MQKILKHRWVLAAALVVTVMATVFSGTTHSAAALATPSSNTLTASSRILADTNGKTDDSSTPDGNSDTADCSTSSGAWSFNWLFCGMYNGTSNLTNWVLVNVIEPQLNISPLCTTSSCKSDSGGADPIYAVWSSFRNYGNVFLLIALLVVVFGQAIGGGLVDAYTAKKVLPRLLVAAILINLSIYIVAGLVDIFNILGNSIGQIITQPVKDAGAFHISANGGIRTQGVGAAATGGLAILTLGGATALFTGAGLSMLLEVIIIPVLLLFLAIVAVIAIRKAIIIALVMISPVAFALYCLPNTEKYFKKWWDLLLEMLMVYPIIVMMFAISSILSVTNTVSGTDDNSAIYAGKYLISFVLMVIPLFIIPFAFKLAGGTLGRISDAVNGGRAKVHGMRAQKRADTMARFNNARDTKKANFWNSGAGRALSSVPIAGYAAGHAQQATAQRIAARGGEVAKSAGAQAIQHDDDALRAATYSNYFAAIKGLQDSGLNRDQAVRAARAAQNAVGFGKAQGSWAAQQMAATGTAYSDIDDVAKTINRVAGSDTTTANALAGNINSTTKSAGRHDLAAGYATYTDLNSKLRSGDQQSYSQTVDKAQGNAWNSGSLYQHANDKPANVKAAIVHHAKMAASGDVGQQQQAAVFFKELEAMKNNASGDVANAVNTVLEGGTLDLGGGKTLDTSRLQAVGERGRNDPLVRQRARSYERPDESTRTT